MILKTVSNLVEQYRKSTYIENEVTRLKVEDRARFWREALTFYKSKSGMVQNLFKRFSVEYLNEDGIDAGALKAEFFSLFFENARNELFESVKDGACIPKRSGGNLQLFKILGIGIAHSILHHGPPFSSLANWCYDFITSTGKE